jgi:nucleoside-diphosphate-sugar epimerase
MNVLITGVNGFVGSNLINNIDHHDQIYGLDIEKKTKEGLVKTFTWNEFQKIPSLDAIIHLAGKAHDTKNTSSEKEYFDVNVGLTKKIIEFYFKSSATKFIFFSSVKAVADFLKSSPLNEEINPDPKTPYGKSKLEAEKSILSEWRKYKKNSDFDYGSSKKDVYILRPCMIHGPGNKGNLNLLYNLSRKGLPWPLGAFENNRSFCSIDNLSFVIQQLIHGKIESGIYQVADDEALSTNELIRLIAQSRNKKPMIWNIPAGPIKKMAKMGDMLHLPMNSERLTKLTESYVVSNQKIKNVLRIKNMPFTAVQGFEKTFASFREI